MQQLCKIIVQFIDQKKKMIIGKKKLLMLIDKFKKIKLKIKQIYGIQK